jgi:uroporphyrin-III C-methyltransferase / precorrin-2 dehydrogenase / sirohydrochlorin ferrochelatase
VPLSSILFSEIGNKDWTVGALDIFPISFKVAGRTIVIVGGGPEALSKARLALKTSARVRVVANKFCADFSSLDLRLVQFVRRCFQGADLDGAALVFVESGGADAGVAIAAARQKNIPLNVIDQPQECDFYTPAIVNRAPLSIAISTQGAAPVLARLIRARIEAMLAPDLGPLAALAGGLRGAVSVALPQGVRRRRFFENLLSVAPQGRDVGTAPLRQKALDLLKIHGGQKDQPGHVWLVGAGPGDVDLLTLRAQRVLQEADIIVYEAGVSDRLVQMGRRDAKTVIWENNNALAENSASQIRGLLGNLGAKGHRVVFLMQGAPQNWQRATCLLAALQGQGLGVEIVRGVDAVSASHKYRGQVEPGVLVRQAAPLTPELNAIGMR